MPTVSHSWKASLPIRCVGTCPVMQTIGIESIKRVGQAGDRIGRAGAGGHQHAADLAGGARIAFGRMHRALLVAHQDVLDLLLLEQLVVDRQHRAAGIAEDVLHALVGQGLDHHFRAGHFLCHRPLQPRSSSGIKKGPHGPPVSAHRRSQVSARGDALPYYYQSNKITCAHVQYSFRCAAYMARLRPPVKPFSPISPPAPGFRSAP